MKIRTKEAKIGDIIIVLICVFVISLCVMPMINLLAQSLSSSDAVINGRVSFLPVINRTNMAAPQINQTEDYHDYQIDDDFSLAQDDESSFYNDPVPPVNYDDFDFSFLDSFDLSSGSDNLLVFDDGDELSSPITEYDYSDEETVEAMLVEEMTDEEFKEIMATREATRNNFKYGITLEHYRYVFLDKSFTWSMWWTAMLTVICTLVSLTMTILCAYPLTYDKLRGKVLLNTIIIFTMYFSAGTIPNYILMNDLGLLNNPLVLIIPNCLSVFYMIILRSFFYGIPDSLRESAEIDGANPFTVLVRIYLPLSAPVLATLALFYAVGRWNGFSDALMYLTTERQWAPIQLKLWQLIQAATSIDTTTVEMTAGSDIPKATDAIKAAAIMFATVPILIVYPWLQRYFISGVTIGAVKG